MKFISTRKSSPAVTASAALKQGLAPDGGLYIPEKWPALKPSDFDADKTMQEVAVRLLTPFFAGDKLQKELKSICNEAFNFPISNRPLITGKLAVLELFHGPTSAFKDVGARFLAQCLGRLQAGKETKLKILVATSGDTGGAVASAFDGVAGTQVVVLYPKGLVSPRQEHQLGCWGDNITTVRVAGRFDDCQALVKAAFVDEDFTSKHALSSANSISIGRLLPQMVYYAWSSLVYWRIIGKRLNYVIPAGNVGNSLACIWAKKVGLPIGKVVLATNENHTIPDFMKDGIWAPRKSKQTLASAMDVGNPSNMERLRSLFPDLGDLREAVRVFSVTDDEIRQTIKQVKTKWDYVICPHTATAFFAKEKLSAEDQDLAWTLVSTAHPAKFDEIVAPLIDKKVDIPPALAALLRRPASCIDIQPDLEALRAVMPD